MDNLLSGLFGGSDDDDNNVRRQRADDFVQRVESGAPWDGITDEEAVQNYQNVAGNLSDDQYMDAARDAFERLSPDQRREFSRYLGAQGGIDVQGDIEDPNELARLTNRARSSQGGGLAGLLGGGGGGDLMGALGGLMGGGQSRGSGLMSNPMVKGVLGSIAASAMRKFMR